MSFYRCLGNIKGGADFEPCCLKPVVKATGPREKADYSWKLR
jgi:hypothetical protein